MANHSILWADDEIELLKPHILFLEGKGYQVTSVNSGSDAVDKCKEDHFDVVFLDENMPGITGLQALEEIKGIRPDVPVVMITKSEEEHIMEEAIGAKIEDYLIKPINPNQILLSVKKILDRKRLVTEKTNTSYQQDFQSITMSMYDADHEGWADIFKKLVHWDIAIEETENKSMKEVLQMQKTEANANFAKFVEKNYVDWLNDEDNSPVLSHQVFKKWVAPKVLDSDSLFLIVVDNLRLDQWKVIQPLLSSYFSIDESTYYSILPTATMYARNALFSGLLPSEMQKKFPQYWVDEDKEGSKNSFEKEFLEANLKRLGMDMRVSYHKILNSSQGKDVFEQANNLLSNKLNTLVYNFVDMLSHARTDTQMVKELAADETAYRSITKSWFENSSLFELLRWLADKKIPVVLTTDHGTVYARRPYKIVGDRSTNTNLRYKFGKSLSYDGKNAFTAKKPEDFYLPKVNVSTSYVFATEDYFFAYPNNYNHYVKYYTDTFQHGGVSLEEMIIPFAFLSPK